MVDKQYLLNTKQLAQFAADGFLRFDELVDDELNQAACAEMEAGVPRGRAGAPLAELWPDAVLGRVVRLPEIQGIIASLVGADPLYDHHAVHTVAANHEHGQIWHADAIIDTRLHFDIQLFYFAHDTPREMGGTMFLPGSQYRRISESDIARYQNFLGQAPMVCKAGTVAVAHHGIWHCAQPNLTDRQRYMFKLRLNPTVRQKRLWNTDDIDDPEIPGLLNANHRWYGNEVRLEVVNRIKFWRFLTGDENYDVSYWLSRLENAPENKPQAA
ncbi:MAG: phytanoyl-CoA dioxygenase family protein [Candidatus Latescibacterota bacterium]|nr:phytanoyl-CoA dioxygenase family protein [Candidatus Latescibacterota bacterium]